MMSDEYRRRAASRLRECRGGWSSGECYYAIVNALELPDTSRNDGGRALYSLLADLIEPSCDRDALLALADEIEDYAGGGGARFGRVIDRDRAKGYAWRIREALGAVE